MATHTRFRPQVALFGLLGLVAAVATPHAVGWEQRYPGSPTISMPQYTPRSGSAPRVITQDAANSPQAFSSQPATMDSSRFVAESASYSLSEGGGAHMEGGQMLEPVEVLDCGQPVPSGCTTCGDVGHDGSICDYVYRSKGCDRIPCPCPTDEVLSYYRCNFYGHYPTFWRPWPGGFLKYRPEVNETMYDRYRKPEPGAAMLPPGEQGPQTQQPPATDLDRELQELMRDSQVPRNSQQRVPPPALDQQDQQRPQLPTPQTSPQQPQQQQERELSPPPALPDQSNNGQSGMMRTIGRFFSNNQRAEPQLSQRRRASRNF